MVATLATGLLWPPGSSAIAIAEEPGPFGEERGQVDVREKRGSTS
jgi:hypothetical protein